MLKKKQILKTYKEDWFGEMEYLWNIAFFLILPFSNTQKFKFEKQDRI